MLLSMNYKQFRLIAALGLILWLLTVVWVVMHENSSDLEENSLDFETIMKHLKDVESQIEEQRELYSNLTRQLVQLQQDTEKHAVANDLNKTMVNKLEHFVTKTLIQKEDNISRVKKGDIVLPIIVFACNRPGVSRCLDGLLKYRFDQHKFPIIVSQDCGDNKTAEIIKAYLPNITYIQQPDQSEPQAPCGKGFSSGYFKISRHYLWGLKQIFRKMNHTAVIIVEDDLDIAPDFYSYFSSTYDLLLRDPSIWCISAWNDNGKDSLVDIEKGEKMLYRSDFFPGLGWMMTRQVWDELETYWPKCFWDDWMRKPPQRRFRTCIRPEISRTRTFGKEGVSNGMYYEDYLKLIKLNDKPVDFSKLNLSYLVKSEYDDKFLKMVNGLPYVTALDVLFNSSLVSNGPVRIRYNSKYAFKVLAKLFGLMEDFQSSVPRTAYHGIVPFYRNGVRVFLFPTNQKDTSIKSVIPKRKSKVEKIEKQGEKDILNTL